MTGRDLRSAGGDPAAAEGIAQCENFLSWHAEIGDAQAAASAFADRMPWLTTAQRDEVVRLYIAERLDLARKMLTRISRRGTELNAEYDRRYNALRNRLCAVVAVVLVTAAVCIPVPVVYLLAGD
ncbi:hypothetical protein ACFWVC_11580 [Streptomyces sp. NPDC058691]|uniref:hypothetical protein n=1 Tax=Streptomyces sp. NPDC058691 TaxID=3346601 RepID=UPI00365C2646